MTFQKIISENKFIFERGYSYIGMLGMAFVIVSSMQQHRPFNEVPVYILFIGGILVTWAIGWVDMKRGFYAAYSHYMTIENPIFERIHRRSK